MNLAVASKSLNLFVTLFKKRKDFSSDSSYADYVRQHLKPNMLVMCNEKSLWSNDHSGQDQMIILLKGQIPVGAVGRVINLDTNQQPLVKWDSNHPRFYDWQTYPIGKVEFLDILTLPIKFDLIDD